MREEIGCDLTIYLGNSTDAFRYRIHLVDLIIGIPKWLIGQQLWHGAAAATRNRMATANEALSSSCVRPDERTVAALRGHADFAELMHRFESTLRDDVFVQPVPCDVKDRDRHQKILLRAESYLVLQIIWKESGLITDEELRAAGLARKYGPGQFTCYALGVELARNKKDVGASNTRIGTIVAAAEIYDLVVRDTFKTRLRPLAGTPLLHSIMMDIIQPLEPHAIAPLIASKGLEA